MTAQRSLSSAIPESRRMRWRCCANILLCAAACVRRNLSVCMKPQHLCVYLVHRGRLRMRGWQTVSSATRWARSGTWWVGCSLGRTTRLRQRPSPKRRTCAPRRMCPTSMQVGGGGAILWTTLVVALVALLVVVVVAAVAVVVVVGQRNQRFVAEAAAPRRARPLRRDQHLAVVVVAVEVAAAALVVAVAVAVAAAATTTVTTATATASTSGSRSATHRASSRSRSVVWLLCRHLKTTGQHSLPMPHLRLHHQQLQLQRQPAQRCRRLPPLSSPLPPLPRLLLLLLLVVAAAVVVVVGLAIAMRGPMRSSQLWLVAWAAHASTE